MLKSRNIKKKNQNADKTTFKTTESYVTTKNHPTNTTVGHYF